MPLPGPDQGDIRKEQRESYSRAKTTTASQYRMLTGAEPRGGKPPAEEPKPKRRVKKQEAEGDE